MPTDVKAAMTELAQAAGWDEATQATVLKAIVENEKASKFLEAGYSRQSEFSRAMDALKKQTDDFEAQKATWNTWYRDAEAAVQTRIAEAVQAKAQLNAYKETFGDLTPDQTKTQTQQQTQQQAFTPEQIQAWMTQQAGGLQSHLQNFVIDSAKVQGDYYQQFNRPMSPVEVDELVKAATSQKRPLMDVYKDFVAPKLAEKTTAEWEAKLKKASEDAVRDALSKHQLPVDAGAKGPSPFLSNVVKAQQGDTRPASESQLRNAFVESWNNAATGAVSK